MNWLAIAAIYKFEMSRWFRTIGQSVASPVISTSLYFVVFGAAIGARMGAIDGASCCSAMSVRRRRNRCCSVF